MVEKTTFLALTQSGVTPEPGRGEGPVVRGPVSSVAGHLAAFNDEEGNQLADSGVPAYNPHGQYASSVSQPIVNVSLAQVITFDTELVSDEITHSTVTDPGKFTIQRSGEYFITVGVSADMLIYQGSTRMVNVWLRVNGIDVPFSNTIVEIASPNQMVVLSEVFHASFVEGDYFEIMLWGDSTNLQLKAVPAATNPVRPLAPSAHMTVQKFNRLG